MRNRFRTTSIHLNTTTVEPRLTDTWLLRTVCFVPGKALRYIFSKFNPLNMDTFYAPSQGLIIPLLWSVIRQIRSVIGQTLHPKLKRTKCKRFKLFPRYFTFYKFDRNLQSRTFSTVFSKFVGQSPWIMIKALFDMRDKCWAWALGMK